MRYFLWILMAAVLTTGCQGPFSAGGFPEGTPYRGYGVDGPGPGVIPPGYPPTMPSAVQPGMMQPGMLPPGYQPMSLHGVPIPNGQEAPAVPGMPVSAAPATNPMITQVGMDALPMGAVSMGAMPAPCPVPVMVAPSSQINFIGPDGLTLYWSEKIRGSYDSEPCVCPGTHDFPQGGVYRLKLVNIPGHPGAELYPTLEVAPTMARTQAYLAHCPVPVEFTPNDFDQAFSGNFVTKVVYLPNPEYQGLAMAGVGTLVNTQLEPGVDPIVEAGNRGAILAIVRLGNKDLGASAKQVEAQSNIPGKMMLAPLGASPMAHSVMPGPLMGQMPGTYAMNGSSIPQNAISGVNIPPYGTPLTKTTTGVVGPPQLPQGRHATNRYPVLRAEPIPVPPVPGATLVQPQPMTGAPYYGPSMGDMYAVPYPQR